MNLELEKPLVSSQHWMDCQLTEEEINSIQKSARIQNQADIETSSAPTTTSTTHSVFTLLLTLVSVSVVKKLYEF